MKCRFLRNYNSFLPKSKPGSEISLKNTGKIAFSTEEDGLMRKITLLTLIVCFLLPVSTARAGEPLLNIFYYGPQGGVYQALTLDNSAQITDDPAQADVFLLNGILPANGDLSLIAESIQSGAGLILILGPELSARDVSTLLGEPVLLEQQERATSLANVKHNEDPILKQIVWTSAPQVRERFVIASNLTPLVIGFEDNTLVLGEKTIGAGKVFVFTWCSALPGVSQPLLPITAGRRCRTNPKKLLCLSSWAASWH
jgi:hypothetical protein